MWFRARLLATQRALVYCVENDSKMSLRRHGLNLVYVGDA